MKHVQPVLLGDKILGFKISPAKSTRTPAPARTSAVKKRRCLVRSKECAVIRE